jgi:hypothetical protein
MRDARKTTTKKRAATPLAPLAAPTGASKTAGSTKKSTARPAAPSAKAAKKAALASSQATGEDADTETPRPRRRRSPSRHEPINDQLVYLSFVVDHPVGSVIEGTVDRFASHGAYVHAGDAQCYVPLRELGDPPPRSAREVLNLGETRSFVVHRFDPTRRGIDVLPATESIATTESGSDAAEAVALATGSANQTPHAEEAHVSPAAKKASTRKKAAARKAPARKKAAAKRAPARKKKATARKSTARKSTAKKKATKKRATTRKKAPAKRTTARKSTAKKTTRKKAPAKKRAAKRTTARKR